MRTYSVAYGESAAAFRLDPGRVLAVLEKGSRRRRRVRLLFEESLDGRSRRRLRGIFANGKRILAVVPDSTRKAHVREILPLFMRMAPRPSQIDVMIATGLHLPPAHRDRERIVGKEVFRRNRVTSHRQGRGDLRRFGTTPNGVPVVLNAALGRYDAVISFGVVEPHLYAGYSGGPKTVAIGLAGEETIDWTHGVAFLDDRRVTIGSVEGNPFHETLRHIAGMVPLEFSVNVVNDAEGNALKVFSGEPSMTFARSVAYARGVFETETAGQADIVVCGVGSPKDANLYQASRSFNYILNTSRPILKKGGVLIVAAELSDGFGRGLGERRCAAALRAACRSSAVPSECGRREVALKIIGDARSRGCVGGEHRAFMIARALLMATIILVGKNTRRIAAGLPFIAHVSIQDALHDAETRCGTRSTVIVVPHALSVIARSRGGSCGS